MSEQQTSGQKFVLRSTSAKSAEENKNVYNEWAETYDQDLNSPDQEYVAPTLVAQAVLAANGNIAGEILDAGCGTGLSGVALAQAGAKTIDGIDLTPAMLKVAEKTGVYRHLAPADLSKEIPKTSDASYYVVTCVGTLTYGHVGPVPALREFVRVTKGGGIVVATVLDTIWEDGGYKAEVDKLEGEGLVEIVGAESQEYRKGAGVRARILVLKKK